MSEYPTEWAYTQACKAVEKHRARAEYLEKCLVSIAEWSRKTGTYISEYKGDFEYIAYLADRAVKDKA